MANNLMADLFGKRPPSPGIGDAANAVVRYGAFTFTGTAAASGDTFDLPPLAQGSIVLDVVAFGPDNISISVGTPAAPTAFISAKTMTAAGLRLSEAAGLLYQMPIEGPLRITYNAVGSSTTGTLRAYVIALAPHA